MKAETYRDHREHEMKHILLIVANEGFVLWFDVITVICKHFLDMLSSELSVKEIL
jgi:hypothetical protein